MSEQHSASVPEPSAVEADLSDLPWALERVTRLCASAYADAMMYRTKLLKGFGYPDETFRAAQDARALSIVLAALRESQAACAQAQDEAVDQRVIGHSEGQEHTIADVNAGRVDDMIAPRLAAACAEKDREIARLQAALDADTPRVIDMA